MVLEKTLESPLDCKEIKPGNPKWNQPWIFTGRTEAEAPIDWPPDAKNWFIGKDPDAGEDWKQEEKAVTEDEMAGWHHRLNEHEFESTLGDSEGQGRLTCPWGRKSWTWLSNWTLFSVNGLIKLGRRSCSIWQTLHMSNPSTNNETAPCVRMRSLVSWVRLFVTPWTVAHQAPRSMGFSQQESWNLLSFPPPGGLPHQDLLDSRDLNPSLLRLLQ